MSAAAFVPPTPEPQGDPGLHGAPFYLPRPVSPPGKWTDNAACKGMDTTIFFPDPPSKRPSKSDEALRVCRRCPVAKECAAYANQANHRYGVWGNAPESDRLPRRSSGTRKTKQ